MTKNRCSNCGTPVKVEQIDVHFFRNVLAGVFFWGWEAFYTVKAVLITPGKSIREYISEDRSKLMNPITFLFLTVLFYSILSSFFAFEPKNVSINYPGAENYESFVPSIMAWLQSHLAIFSLIIGAFESILLYWFFKKQHYNFFEILSLVCYVTGVWTLLSFFITLTEQYNFPKWTTIVSYSLFLVYMVWATAQFLGTKIWTYLKVIFAYLLGLTFCILIILIIGILIDLFVLNFILGEDFSLNI